MTDLVEDLARALHESGRAAVEHGLVVNKVPGQPFFAWAELTPAAQEGRRVQARYLVTNGWVKLDPASIAPPAPPVPDETQEMVRLRLIEARARDVMTALVNYIGPGMGGPFTALQEALGGTPLQQALAGREP